MKTNIGLAVQPPAETCTDSSCAWHGQLPVRGRVFTGTVRSAKAHRTLVVERGFTKFVQKYERYERRSSRFVAHNPDCLKAKEGDTVVIAECRPISKTKHFVVVSLDRPVVAKPVKKAKKKK